MNTYAYVGGNPISNIDPTGLRALTDCEKGVLSKYLPSAYLNEADVNQGLPYGMLPGFGGITLGSKIYLSQDRPDTAAGIALLGHEVSHSVQQDVHGAGFFSSYALQSAVGFLSTFDTGAAHDSINYEKLSESLERRILADLKQSGGDPCGCTK